MQQQKGQIEIVLFVLVIIGAAILFFVFAKPGNKEASEPNNKPPVVSSPVTPKAGEKTYSSPGSVDDKTPPYRSNPQPIGQLPAIARAATLSLNTDEKAVCRYSDVSNMGYGAMKAFAHTDATFHYTDITGLGEGQGYVYYVKCADAYNNANTDDLTIYFYVKTPDDFTPPVISNQYPTGDTLPKGTTQTMIGISTNELASCRYDIRQNISYDSMGKSLTDDGTKKYHTAQVIGLIPGGSYNYFVRCKDMTGNVNTGDVMVSFQIAP